MQWMHELKPWLPKENIALNKGMKFLCLHNMCQNAHWQTSPRLIPVGLVITYQEMMGGGELKTLQFMTMSPPSITAYSWLSFVSIRGATSKKKGKDGRFKLLKCEVIVDENLFTRNKEEMSEKTDTIQTQTGASQPLVSLQEQHRNISYRELKCQSKKTSSKI